MKAAMPQVVRALAWAICGALVIAGCGDDPWQSDVAGSCHQIEEMFRSPPVVDAEPPDAEPLNGSAYRARCFPRALPVDCASQAPCIVIEARTPPTGEACSCDSPARKPADPANVTSPMRETESCFCEIVQLAGEQAKSCRFDVTPAEGVDGFCYVDGAQGLGSAEILKDCPAQDQRILRFVGKGYPLASSRVWERCIYCEGDKQAVSCD